MLRAKSHEAAGLSTSPFSRTISTLPVPDLGLPAPALSVTSEQDADPQAAVARASAIARAATRTANPPKSYPQKTRGKKAAAAKSAEKEEDVIELD